MDKIEGNKRIPRVLSVAPLKPVDVRNLPRMTWHGIPRVLSVAPLKHRCTRSRRYPSRRIPRVLSVAPLKHVDWNTTIKRRPGIPRVLSVAPLKHDHHPGSNIPVSTYSTRPKRGPIEAGVGRTDQGNSRVYSTRPKRGPIEATQLALPPRSQRLVFHAS